MPPNMQSFFSRSLNVSALTTAWRKVRGNDGCAGGDGVTIARFAPHAHSHITALSAAILGGSYTPRALRHIAIDKPSGGQRMLAIPSVSDRIAQTAAATALSPLLEPDFSPDSYGYRPGKSVLQAVRRISALQRRGYTHVVEADIKHCFDTIPHDPLLALLERRLGPEAQAFSDLVALWLAHMAAETGQMGRGLAQGSPLSPLLANLYLDQLDEAFERKNIALVRFADDFVILCKSEKAAEAALADAGAVLRAHGLELCSDKTGVVSFERGFGFLGHLFVRAMVLQQEAGGGDDYAGVFAEQAALDTRQAEGDAAEALEFKAGYDAGARVLHVVGDNRRVRRRNLSFVVENEQGREMVAIAHARVDRIELGPNADTDLDLIRHAMASDTELAFVDGFGETLGQLSAPPQDRARLHLAQAKLALDPAAALDLARRFVDARLRNGRTRLHLLNRSSKDSEVIEAVAALGRYIRKLPAAESVASLRGLEGAAAAVYWPALARNCAEAQGDFRRTRPAKDPLNAAINYLTALLMRDIRAALLARGLHPGFGALHSATNGHEACVWDMAEGYRAMLNEGLAVALFNQRRLRARMFASKGGGVQISATGRRALVVGYETTCGRVVKSPFSGKRRKVRMIMREDATALAKHCLNSAASPYKAWLQDH